MAPLGRRNMCRIRVAMAVGLLVAGVGTLELFGRR
jgi:hypothetical protein